MATDLSHLLPGDPVEALTGRESQAATNTVSQAPPMTAPGSVSESTAGAEAGEPGPHGTSFSQRVAVERGHSRPAVIKTGEWNEVP